jgi:hypothetical protein
MNRLLIWVWISFLLSGCTRPLSVQTRYIAHEHLASYYVGTPDPNLHQSLAGQQLIISWYLSKAKLAYKDLQLHLRMRFRDRQEKELFVPIAHENYGYYVYQLLNENYWQTGDVLTYKVEIIGDGCVLESWLHPLWVELIKINEDQK